MVATAPTAALPQMASRAFAFHRRRLAEVLAANGKDSPFLLRCQQEARW